MKAYSYRLAKMLNSILYLNPKPRKNHIHYISDRERIWKLKRIVCTTFELIPLSRYTQAWNVKKNRAWNHQRHWSLAFYVEIVDEEWDKRGGSKWATKPTTHPFEVHFPSETHLGSHPFSKHAPGCKKHDCITYTDNQWQLLQKLCANLNNISKRMLGLKWNSLNFSEMNQDRWLLTNCVTVQSLTPNRFSRRPNPKT